MRKYSSKSMRTLYKCQPPRGRGDLQQLRHTNALHVTYHVELFTFLFSFSFVSKGPHTPYTPESPRQSISINTAELPSTTRLSIDTQEAFQRHYSSRACAKLKPLRDQRVGGGRRYDSSIEKLKEYSPCLAFTVRRTTTVLRAHSQSLLLVRVLRLGN